MVLDLKLLKNIKKIIKEDFHKLKTIEDNELKNQTEEELKYMIDFYNRHSYDKIDYLNLD